MAYQSAERILRKLLKYADIELNGSKAWDIQVHRKEFYTRVIKNPVLGLGETYMEGWWDCQALDEFFFRILRAPLTTLIVSEKSFFLYIFFTKIKLFFVNLINLQTPARAFQVGKIHYDKGNFLYECMLDKRMNYSCGYWKTASTLDEAQEAKLELICQKLQLKPGMRVLDIGCGWGGFSKYAAENYGVSVVGITISREQLSYAKANCASLSVEFRFQDYRDLDEKFDRICSIGMFEHVGEKNYKNYFKVAHRCLSEDGLFLLHTIGSNVSQKSPNEWIHRYIFPNGILPSIAQIGSSIENLFVMEDWHNFGAFYDKTLQAWQMNFTKHYDVLKKHYDQRFFRMWNYYLLACAGAFRARDIQLWQVVLSKHGRLSGYDSVR